MRVGEGPNVELRFLIYAGTAGIIIGRGGENIKKIREDYFVKVNIPNSTGSERVLVLDGDLGSILEIFRTNLEKMQSCDNGVDLRMLVHQSQAGCVIGKGGNKIKKLREQSNLHTLRVYQMLCPFSTDRVIQLVGDVNEVVNCLQSIVELLEDVPPKGSRQNYDARNCDELIAHAYGGWKSASRVRGRNNVSNVNYYQNVVSNPRSFGVSSNTVHNRNSNQHVAQCVTNNIPHASVVAMLAATSGQDSMGHSNGTYNDPNTTAGLVNRRMQNTCDLSKMTPTSITQVSVSNKMIGAIMGRSGCRINQVRQESNATIMISKQEPGIEDRIITITGTPDQIQNAQFLLQMCVKRYGDQSA